MFSFLKNIFRPKVEFEEERDWHPQHFLNEYEKSIEEQEEILDKFEKSLNE